MEAASRAPNEGARPEGAGSGVVETLIPRSGLARSLTPDLEGALRAEIATWSSRLDRELAKARAKTPLGERFLENMRAYRADSAHFLATGDLVRSFECVVWAWAWLEIGGETHDLDWTYPEHGFEIPPGTASAAPAIAIERLEARPAEDVFRVRVTDSDGSSTEHLVAAKHAYVAKLAPGRASEEVVRAAFGFLLEKEKKEGLFRAMDLAEIRDYWHDFEVVIARRLGAPGR